LNSFASDNILVKTAFSKIMLHRINLIGIERTRLFSLLLPAIHRALMVVVMQLETGPPLDEVSIACVLRELLLSLDYLHSEGKIHSVIKGALLSFL
jgi:serine/threonine protein kinase